MKGFEEVPNTLFNFFEPKGFSLTIGGLTDEPVLTGPPGGVPKLDAPNAGVPNAPADVGRPKGPLLV